MWIKKYVAYIQRITKVYILENKDETKKITPELKNGAIKYEK